MHDRSLGIILSGPNLRLDDLRWLVARCEGMPGDAGVQVTEASSGSSPADIRYPRIVVEDRSRPPVMRSGGRSNVDVYGSTTGP